MFTVPFLQASTFLYVSYKTFGGGRGRGQVEKSVLPLEEVCCKQNNGEHDFKKKSQETLLVIKFIRGATEFFLRLTL